MKRHIEERELSGGANEPLWVTADKQHLTSVFGGCLVNITPRIVGGMKSSDGVWIVVKYERKTVAPELQGLLIEPEPTLYTRHRARNPAEWTKSEEVGGKHIDHGRCYTGHTIAECRSEPQKHHPDKGGDADQFQIWTNRLKLAEQVSS